MIAVTGSRWLLDTSILVDVFRGHESAKLWVDSIAPPQRFLSVVTAAELLAGCRNRQEQRAVEREIGLYRIVWLDESISRKSFELYRTFHLSHGAGFLDCLIAATGITHGFLIATLNLKHFEPLSGVKARVPY
ncbi:MAG: type II toxin-antitoxin system VapC family toxin [Deferrisomatales bacterium]|nr:type II toxin-antitoxin system VapC family toxin [Deferrisomatales bacterium]